ncbi:glycoside hydrolase superfamily [Xylariaceae sp. FL0255]|nr:glycoside hydrolase superfamily [Xylariaceae sp. FL0255]
MGIAAAAVPPAQNTSNAISINVPYYLNTRPLWPDVYGYSIEPIWLDAYINTTLTTNLLASITTVTGAVPPPIRIGGNTADETYLYLSSSLPLSTGGNGNGNDNSAALPNLTSANTFDVTPRWFQTWANYFPEGTKIRYTLNLADNSSDWANAVAEAEAVHETLGDSLEAFELGNEIDHFIAEGWRGAGWDVKEYISQFRNLTGLITTSTWYKTLENSTDNTGPMRGGGGGSHKPTFQAGVIADRPKVPDQQVEQDNFSIANLTAAGIAASPAQKAIISSYSDHLYPQSACDSAHWHRMRLDLLSNHEVLWQNISQHIPEISAAEAAGAPLVLGETNSVSCSGRSGISDTFGAALWSVDYSQYSAFTPLGYELEGEMLVGGIRANWYAHYFVARILRDGKGLWIAALPTANSSTLSGFALYDGDSGGCSRRNQGKPFLRKLVFLDMGIWNGTSGLSNPSTLSATDGTMFSTGTRPVSSFQVATPWKQGTAVKVIRLKAPGTNAKSGVTVAGTTFQGETGSPMVSGDGQFGDEFDEILHVDTWGMVNFGVQRAQGVLLEMQTPGSTMPGLISTHSSSDSATSGSALPRQTSTSTSGAATGAGVNTGAGITREKTAAELEADRLYEEAMEEEYAKREGGA